MIGSADIDGQRDVLGMDSRPSEGETFWTAFLRKLDTSKNRSCMAGIGGGIRPAR